MDKKLWKDGLRLSSTQIKIDPTGKSAIDIKARKLQLQKKKKNFCDLYLGALFASMVSPWKGTKD